MNKVYLLIGSNLGDRIDNLARAKEMINSHIGEILKLSAVYETEPWGFHSDSDFLNQCLLVETEHTPEQVLGNIYVIENSLGRNRKSASYESRVIDIDILFYNREILHIKGLHIPHREFHNRNFALVPMEEIAPLFKHPVYNKSIFQLRKESKDKKKVIKYEE